jgi:hypothetical protein
VVALGGGAAWAAAPAGQAGPAKAESGTPNNFKLAYPTQQTEPAPKTMRETTELTTIEEPNREYKEVSDFFNIREANSSVEQGEWELEVEGEWVTGAGAGDDDFSLAVPIKYGITNDLFVELEVMPMNMGDGGDGGAGDLALQVFYQFLHETDALPAFATWAEMRIPSGDQSSGVDGELHFNLTKTLCSKFRAHFEGWIMTANGSRGEAEGNRRDFQWGVGPGFDYEIDAKTIAVLNYLMRSSEEEGHHNQNILEFGLAREIVEHQWVKAALDVGLDGQEETPEFGFKLMWDLSWK